MKLFILLGIFCVCSSLRVYYVAPNHDNCTIALQPCYTLHQIIAENLLLSNVSSVELLFLTGTHLIPENQLLRVLDFSEVIIHSYDEEEVVIECELEAGLEFQNIANLNISSLHFKYCFLWNNNVNSIGSSQYEKTSVTVTQCIFERSQTHRAISFTSTVQNLIAIFSNCTFLFNYRGAITLQCIDCLNKANLGISDTLFNGNGNQLLLQKGGALKLSNSNLIVHASNFINNLATIGTIYAEMSNLILKYTIFHNNSVIDHSSGYRSSGSAISIYGSSLDIDHCHFINNFADGMGTIFMAWNLEITPSSINNSFFQGNKAGNSGGALIIFSAVVAVSHCKFINNSAKDGGALYCFAFSQVYIQGGHFILNTAKDRGGFAYLANCHLFNNMPTSKISRNKAWNGGAIYMEESKITCFGNIKMANNYAGENGGALHLVSSHLEIYNPFILSNNVAHDKGGAIFVADSGCEKVLSNDLCFFQDVKEQSYSFIFTNNTASQGPVLYGGLLDRCFTPDGALGITDFKDVSDYEPTPLAITSAPVRVCLCTETYQPNCTERELALTKMSGEVFDLIGTVVDQDSNPSASYIIAGYEGLSAQLDIGEGRKETGSNCSKLSYHVFTRNTSAVLFLQPEGYCELSTFSNITVHINIAPCSRGFELHSDRCGCDRRLTNYLNITTCNISTDSVQRKGTVWLRYDEEELKVHISCPLDYCQTLSDTISLAHPDEQCANHRSGVICGACQHNYSIALGGSKCLQCTSSYAFAWLIPVFAVAGVALVALLLVCNLTVAHGTLNELIFYANIVSITELTSLSNCSIHPILSVFIAWVNLDFGVETCFYAGMDTYQKTWLQLAFPLYIWLLVGVIILASHYSGRAMKVFGINNISILATLFLLSYTKILKTITASINFTEVLVGSANDTSDQLAPYKVWTYDGNITYLTGKHLPLFAVGLVMLIFLFLPYTLLLTFGQCIRSRKTRIRCLSWCIHSTAFVSIMDAYHAPYNKRHRYWVGLMLLTRCVLFLSIASNSSDQKLLTSMYISNVILIGILILKTWITKAYANYYINILELCFLLNLAVLSSTVYYLGSNNSGEYTICRCTSASISVSLVSFFGILMYHAYLRIKKTKVFSSITNAFLTIWSRRKPHQVIPTEESKLLNTQQKVPTKTTVEVREELLDIGDT